MSKPRITYGSWVAVNAERTLTEVERKRMSSSWRVWEISVAAMNNWGHATFRLNELCDLVCGSHERSDKAALHRAMKTLAEMGRIAPVGEHGSTEICIMVNLDIATRAAGKGGREFVCWESGHAKTRETSFHGANNVVPINTNTDDGDDYPDYCDDEPDIFQRFRNR
jgi:hypothetical protein